MVPFTYMSLSCMTVQRTVAAHSDVLFRQVFHRQPTDLVCTLRGIPLRVTQLIGKLERETYVHDFNDHGVRVLLGQTTPWSFFVTGAMPL